MTQHRPSAYEEFTAEMVEINEFVAAIFKQRKAQFIQVRNKASQSATTIQSVWRGSKQRISLQQQEIKPGRIQPNPKHELSEHSLHPEEPSPSTSENDEPSPEIEKKIEIASGLVAEDSAKEQAESDHTEFDDDFESDLDEAFLE